MRAASKIRAPNESARGWFGFKWRSRHSSFYGKEAVLAKGPAFWNKAATDRRKKVRVRPLKPSTWKGSRVFRLYKNYCGYSWLDKAVYVLVAVALTLFLILMSLISAYITKAKDLHSFKVQLAARQYRLGEAVRHYAPSQPPRCVPCPENWMQSAGSCYLFTPEMKSWQDCIGHCQAQEGSLFMGHTEGEMDLLMLETQKRFTVRKNQRIPGVYWIGLIYNKTVQRWHWADGAYLHLRMHPAEHKHVPAGDICIAFRAGHIDYKKCTYKYHCLCKKKAP